MATRTNDTMNVDDLQSLLRHSCSLVYRFFNVHVLHCMRLYHDNSYSVYINHEPWGNHFLKHHLNSKCIKDYLELGFRRWKNIDNSEVAQAERDATDNFELAGLANIVKASSHEIGCYDIYTFALDKTNQHQIDSIYEECKRTLVEWVAAIESSFVRLVIKHPSYNQRKRLCDKHSQKEEQRLIQWMGHHEYAHQLMGQKYASHLNAAH